MIALNASKTARWYIVLIIFLLVVIQPVDLVLAAPRQVVVIPAGFRQVEAVAGVILYRKDYSGGSPDYVQVVDLGSGAEVHLLSGELTEQRKGKGAYEGNDARFRSKTVQAYFETYERREDRLFCATNGSFFYMPEYPTRLPFPLKSDGQILTDGYAANQFEGKKLILEIWPGYADIKPLSAEILYQSSAPSILGGLAADANKRATNYTGRTFVGVHDSNSDGWYETILIFSSRTATQAHAAETLQSFGAQKVMMLDGGGSTQLVCNSRVLVSSERLVPQALAVLAGGSGASAPQLITPASMAHADLPASNLINASPPPTSVPFNPDDSRPAVILPGSASPVSSISPIEQPVPSQAEAPAAAAPQAASEQEIQPPANTLLNDPEFQPSSLPQVSGQAISSEMPLYDLSDILLIPMFMLPIVIVIFVILIRRQFERFSL